jgi:hypothetical protein
MALPDILFKGVPRRYTRGYTADAIRAVRPDKVIIPCVGAYALATTAVEAGIKPENIEACDISLYSTAIGMMLSGRPWRLEAIGQFGWLNDYIYSDNDEAETRRRQVSAVVVATRLCQYAAKRDFLYEKESERYENGLLPTWTLPKPQPRTWSESSVVFDTRPRICGSCWPGTRHLRILR